MPDINLLPWREELREERKRQFFSALALTAVLAGLIGFAWHTWVNSFIDAQAQRNKLLETVTASLKRSNQGCAKNAATGSRKTARFRLT